MKTLTLYAISLFALANINCDTSEAQGDIQTPQNDAFTTVTRITPTGIIEGDNFGFSIAATSEFTAVSAPNDNEKGQRTGAVYILRRSGLNFENTVHILYPENATTEDRFGWSIAISNEFLVIGAPQNDKEDQNSGAVYIYTHAGDNKWNLVKELIAPNPQKNQQFGHRVAIDQGTILVSSLFDEDNYYDTDVITNAGGTAQGSVFVYEESSGWGFSQKLVPESEQGHIWDAFGTALTIEGNYLAIGAKGTDNTTYKAPGSVYIFQKTGNQWLQQDRIEATDGETDDFFGANLDLDGGDLAITAPGSFNSLLPGLSDVYGAAYIFKRSGSNFAEEIKLLAEEIMPKDDFGGGGIALHRDYVIVGAPLKTVITKFNGAAYFFERTSGWPESHKIVASDPLNEDLFGGSIAATDDLLFVGAHRRCNETGCHAGALYFVN